MQKNEDSRKQPTIYLCEKISSNERSYLKKKNIYLYHQQLAQWRPQ